MAEMTFKAALEEFIESWCHDYGTKPEERVPELQAMLNQLRGGKRPRRRWCAYRRLAAFDRRAREAFGLTAGRMSKSTPIQRPRTDNPFTGIEGRPKNFVAEHDSQRFGVCEECGQAFDRRDLGEVFHYMRLDHNRLAEDS